MHIGVKLICSTNWTQSLFTTPGTRISHSKTAYQGPRDRTVPGSPLSLCSVAAMSAGADCCPEGADCSDPHFPVGKEASMDQTVSCPSNMQQVLFVECGWGCDQHGQNATKAVVRACRNAIEFNSIPCVSKLVPNGYNGLKLCVKIGTPSPELVDLDEVKKVFPYGQVDIQMVEGGLRACSGIAIKDLGDKNDDMLIAVAAVTVGY